MKNQTNKVAIYARFSSDDLQNDTSIDDQIRICENKAKSEGWSIVKTYTDHGISGASIVMRQGVQLLMQDIAQGKFDIVLTESLDRISRDQEDTAAIFKRIQFAGTKLFTLSDGFVSKIHVGMRGTYNAMFLDDLALKTHRGLSGRVLKGKSGGGIAYGYDVVKKFDSDGNPIKGDRTINEEQAEIVRRIFKEYVSGISPKAIAIQLNKEKIPSPSGASWGASTINGNRRRGTGILNNDLYVGLLVWNRQKFLKDPDTGKRIPRLNPQSEWQKTRVPELQFIEDDLWDAAKARQRVLDEKPQFWGKQRPRKLFSHLLVCGVCGGGVSKVNTQRYGCSNASKKATCENHLTVKQDYLEHTILDALQNHLMDARLVKVFCEEYTHHINEMRRNQNATIDRLKNELSKLAENKQKIIDAIKEGFPANELKEELDTIISRRAEIEGQLEGKSETTIRLHPKMALRYQEKVIELIEELNNENKRAESSEILRSLIRKIVLTPNEAGTDYEIVLYGDLAGILTIASGGSRKLTDNDPLVEQAYMIIQGGKSFHPEDSTKCSNESKKSDKVVAGAGFAPNNQIARSALLSC